MPRSSRYNRGTSGGGTTKEPLKIGRDCRMAVKYTDLELALNTLVNGFFSETKDGHSTLDTAEFKTLVSNQLPTLAKTVGEDGGLQTVLRQMGVEEGQDITFENFWALVQKQASDQVTAAPDKKFMRGCSVS
ncbi:unnamed protein product [Boreogadus saida]